MSVGILSPSGEVEFGAWGNRTETGEKVASDTIFGVASLSKGFLSASLGILMQDFAEGKNTTAFPQGVKEFNWETKMRDLLPGEWKTEDEFSTNKADLTDLLSHTTGLPAHDASYSPDESPRDLVLRMRNLRAAYEFRQRFEYNNQMFITGSYVVSKLSGMEYRDFVEKRIMLPLNMSSSTMHPDRVSKSDRFSQTWTPSGRRIPFFMDEQMAKLIAGAGGVISTAEDLLLSWLRVDGYGADHTPFDEDSINDWKVTFMEENGKVVGLGFFVAENESWRAKEGGSVRDIADVWFDKI
ncbi:Beta-lactamase domain-containing protein [Mycena venus]|uniref:Beta-lactamase domain-containing protein n=1 Tax=Mycena venus TaxID=2733690 RepID=A0A8H7D809_9AGAR|nr:Beta-lactamase domain-containing protein [Mycena venus]